MKTIEISNETYAAIANHTHDVAAFIEAAARQAIRDSGEDTPRFDPAAVLAGFKKLEGMFGNASLDDALADRRRGLE